MADNSKAIDFMVKGEKMKKIRSKFQFGIFVICFTLISVALISPGIPVSALADQSNELVIQTWGGAKTTADLKAFYEPFTEETGIKITVVEGAGESWGKIASQVRSGNIEWDLTSGFPYPAVAVAAQKGLLEEIDYSIVTATEDLIPGSTKKYGLAQEINVVVLAYNTNKWPGDNHPKSWADFYDVKKFPGPRGMANWGCPEENLITALLADGVEPDKLVPIDYDRAFKKLDQIKPHVKVWFTSGNQLINILQSEEVVMAQAMDGRAKYAMQIGAPIKLEWDQGLFTKTYWSVVKGAPHKDLAMKFLNFINRPELQAIFTNYIWYSSANTKSINFLHPTVQQDQAVHPNNFEKLIPVPSEKTMKWLVEHQAEMNEKFDTWLQQ